MNRLNLIGAALLLLPPSPAETRDQIVGTWTLVLVDNVLPDTSRVHLYGPDPHGIL